MTRHLTKPEVIRRIAMRALLDAVPGMTHARLVTLCRASYTTVHDAANTTIQDWLSVLEAAPNPRPSPTGRRHSTPRHSAATSDQAKQHSRPGDRRRARLVGPDAIDQAVPPGEDTDVDIEPTDAAWEDDRHVIARDPLDDPVPRRHTKPSKRGSR
jgi:hypothetical protein